MIFRECTKGAFLPFAYRLLRIMKLAIFLAVACVFQVIAEGKAQKITLSVKEETLREVMKEIQRQQGYLFFFRGDHIASKRVSATIDRADLPDAMDLILANHGLAWSLKGKTIIIRPGTAPDKLPFPLARQDAQQRVIVGKVTDELGTPLDGVTVVVKGSSTVVMTDDSGSYQLTVGANATTLVFTSVGFETQERAINDQRTLNVVLRTTVSDLDEVVVVGYGTQLKSTITGSVKQLDGSQLASQASVSTSAALMGKIPGVQVVQNSGQPGQNSGTIRIRGIGTLGNSNPLVLIDGIPGSIDNIPSVDVENVTILKDAASSAVYGSRAANGVILVTTKKGVTGKPQVRYQTFFGLQSPTNQPEFVDGEQFMRLQNLGATNLGATPIWSDDYLNQWRESHVTDPDNYPSTDWVKEAFSEAGLQQRHALSVSGGNDMVTYLSSIAYDNEQSNIPNYNFKRYSFRLNSGIQVSDKLGFDFDVNVVRRDQTSPSQGIDRIITDIYRLPAVYVSRFGHGGWGPAFNLHNPIAYIHDGGLATGATTDSRIRLAATIKPTEGLSVNFVYSPVQNTVVDKRMVKHYEINDSRGAVEQVMPEINGLTNTYGSVFNHNANVVANYRRQVAEHQVSAMAGYEFVSSKNTGFSASRNNFEIQDYEELDAGSVANQLNSGKASEWALQSVFGRLNYGFAGRYLLEGNLRYDGSSRFERNHKWSLFPSFSAGWVISEEGFLRQSDWLDYMKIRGSWGILGNQEIGNYPFLSTMNLNQSYIFGGSPVSGAAQLELANPIITWERNENTNIGFDLALWNNRFNITYDYFVRNTSDILLRLPVPLILGLTAPYQNAGEVRNSGSEFEVSYQQTLSSGFHFSTSFNISHVKNRVTNLRGAGPFIAGATIIAEGYAMESIFGYQSLGLYQNETDISDHAQQVGLIAPGDIKYRDINPDGVINADDRTVIGNSFPALNYGFNLSVRYKGVDLSTFLQGVGNRDVYLSGYAAWPLYNGTNIRTWQAESFWTPERPDASMPRLTAGTSHSNFQASDFWVFNASYLRLRNFQLGYTLSEDRLQALRINSIRLFVMGENLFTFSKMPQGVDPNVPNGDTYFPISKLLSFGFHINL